MPEKKQKKEGEKDEIYRKKMMDIAEQEYTAAGVAWDDTLKEGVGQWAHYSADEDYADEDAVRAELREYIAQEKEYEG